MKTYVEMHGKDILVILTDRAIDVLNIRAHPITMEMELVFSSMIEKRVHLREQIRQDDIPCFQQKLYLCLTANILSSSHVDTYIQHDIQPIKKLKPYVPKWCRLDNRHNEWLGEFSYDRREKIISPQKDHLISKH